MSDEDEHFEHLNRVSSGDDPFISAETATEAGIAWETISLAANGRMLYCRDTAGHHPELEFVPGAEAEFFYEDRETRSFWDADCRVGDPLPAEAVAKLEYFV